MGSRWSWKIGSAVLAASLLGRVSQAASWYPLGPFGGDARSLAADPADPKHLFLGTATGWIYNSHDGGSTWTRVAQVANRNDLAIDHIVVDRTNPRRLVVGAFVVDHPADGGLYISEDYGKNWYSQAEMRGQSVRALARSDSDPKELVAGTLKGVFRSRDNGIHWQQISPPDSTEIHEIQSVAIDPSDPDVIYAGTWHLPWKTTDGGTTWHNIKEGVIDDSDVFSIIVDPKNPKTVYASACSGIYKSSNGGEMFRKVEGIPSAARRTRRLEQDPADLSTVFAGTTEGLYRTLDAGEKWERLTPGDVIVNDVYVDPTNDKHVLLATDRGGVYRSEDGGTTFESSNSGFSTRQVTAYASDSQNAGKVYVGVVNGKTTGGVFESDDGAVHWQQQSQGLGGRDIFSLLSLDDGTLLAGTGHGIFRFSDGSWKDSSLIEGAPVPEKVARAAVAPPYRSVAVPVKSSEARGSAPMRMHLVSHASAVHGAKRATSKRESLPSRATRKGVVARGGLKSHVRQVSAARRSDVAVRRQVLIRVAAVQTSRPGARSKAPAAHKERPPVQVKPVRPGRIDAEVFSLLQSGGSLYAATGMGLLRSGDAGQHWETLDALQIPDLRFLALDPNNVSSVTPVQASTLPAMPTTGSSGDSAPSPLSAVAGPAQSPSGQQAAATGMFAAGLSQAMRSSDAGASWQPVSLPKGLTQIGAVCIDGEKRLWIGGREGVWYSTDNGTTWKTLRNLFLTEVDSLFYDAGHKRVLVTGANSSAAFSVSVPENKVTYLDTGWKLRFVRPVGDHLVGATLFDGMVVQPEMVDSPVATLSRPR